MTLAAKHMDPLVGVDVHIVQPPGPVPPVPIPHPYVGMLIDPFDYVPIVGSTVLINGMHRGQAGTEGKCLPPHIPIGGVFVKPPGNESEMFMGSATVVIDGDAQSFMALPALSCQCIGMPPIPRTKKSSQIKTLVLPTSVVLPIPAGPPVLIGGPPTIFTMAMGMKIGMAALGKGLKKLRKLQKGSKGIKKLSDSMHAAAKKGMDKLGVPPNIQNKIHKGICSVTGHPVDIATGKVFTDTVDFELPGPLPLQWERTYFTTSTYDGPIGHGWHHTYDLALIEEDEAVAVRMSDGRPVAFPRLEIGETFFDRTERLTLSRDMEGYSLTSVDGLTWNFSRVTFDSDEQALIAVHDRAGNIIEFDYDKHGHLEMIHDSAQRKLPVRTDDRGRILEIRAPHPDEAGQTITLVAYDYDSHGRLIEARDALEQPMTYQYDGFLLSKETDRVGLSFYFEYDGTDHTARCIHTWGDDGIYNHRLDYDAELQRTVVTNSRGHQTIHYWNENGAVFKAVDPLGNEVQTVYNEFNQPQVELDELGLPTAYEYDERGNQTAVVTPDGSAVQVEYNERDLPVKAVDPLGSLWSWEYNSRGQLSRRVDSTGRETRFQYTDRSLTSIIDSAGNKTELSYGSTGCLDAVTAPNGCQSRWQYDALGRATTAFDLAGNCHQRRFDLLGRLMEVKEPDGNTRTISYDAMGNVLHAKDLQHDVRFTYQGMGRLATRREAGTTVEFKYNSEEDLTGIVNEHGRAYRFDLDERGDVAREYGFDDIRRVYTRDNAGRLIRMEQASGLITFYEYDPAGRVIGVKHSDGTEESYVYRKDGELIEAENSSCAVKFERDPQGRILKEWQDDYWVSSAYDEHGLRKEMRSCFGAIQKIDRNAMGDVTGMQYQDAQKDPTQTAWEARVERDQMGLEVERTLPGGIRSRWERDKLGRPVRHEILGGAQAARDVKYVWDANDRLKTIVDAHHGTTVFEHDDVGNLAAATYGDGVVDLRMPDAVGNLFRTKDRNDRKYGQAGEILESRSNEGMTRYEYDAEGNLIRKSTPQGEWLYTWNAAGMLQSVQRPDGERVEFEYDPLGRRISKTFRGKTTRWIWDGNNPLHEWVEGGDASAEPADAVSSESSSAPPAEAALVANPATGPPEDADEDLLPAPADVITWLFDPETFAPAAKLVGGERYSIVTDYLGTPTSMLDSTGQLVWSASISIYGDLRNIQGDHHGCPFRWSGQYEDEETGLYYNRFRYFDPDTGIYICQDPITLEGGMALYRYVGDPNSGVDPLGLVINTTKDRTHITYKGTKGGKPYVGYASMPGNKTGQQVLASRYSSGFTAEGLDGPPTVMFREHGDTLAASRNAKATARGLEQRLFEQAGGLADTANAQNPVGINNANRDKYLKNADSHLAKQAPKC